MSNRNSAVRSRADVVRIALACIALSGPAGVRAQAPTPDEVRHAAAEVAKDPDLGGARKEKVLRLREEPKPDTERPDE